MTSLPKSPKLRALVENAIAVFIDQLHDADAYPPLSGPGIGPLKPVPVPRDENAAGIGWRGAGPVPAAESEVAERKRRLRH